jgi:DNA-binding MarR family transcriptional regulator
VDALQRDGLVTREPNPEDARSVLVRATPTGKLALSRGRARRVQDLAAGLTVLSPEELAVMAAAADLMERVAGRARERP